MKMALSEEALHVSRCPHRLCVSKGGHLANFEEEDMHALRYRISGLQAITLLNGVIYAGFSSADSLRNAIIICKQMGWAQVRAEAVDPYTVVAEMYTARQRAHMLTHFSEFGSIAMLHEWHSKSRNTGFLLVTFLDRRAALRAAFIGKLHCAGNIMFPVRPRILPPLELACPAPWSPARYYVA